MSAPLDRLRTITAQNVATGRATYGITAEDYVGKPCTLDGKPATIAGRSLPYALVAELDGPLQLEYSWQAVHRIMQAGGAFRS